MRQHLPLRLWVSTLLIVALVGLGLPDHPAEAYQGGNLLQNPGFEGEYVTIGGDASVRLAPNWQPWSLATRRVLRQSMPVLNTNPRPPAGFVRALRRRNITPFSPHIRAAFISACP